MDFALTEEQVMLRDSVWEFAKNELLGEEKNPPLWRHWRQKGVALEIHKKFVKQGYSGALIGEEYEGANIGMLSFGLMTEQISRASLGAGLTIGTSLALGAEPIQHFGSKEQKEYYLPRIAKGSIMAYAQTESGAGSDVSAIKTKGVFDGNELVINGSKIFCTNGSIADDIIMIVRTGQRKYRGLTMVIVDAKKAKAEGSLIIDRDEDKLGLHCSPTTAFTCNDCRVPVSNIIGDPEAGFFYATTTLIGSRPMIALQAVGAAQAAFDCALQYLLNREQFGRKIAANQAIQHELADMQQKIEAARLLSYRAAWEVEQTCKIEDPAQFTLARVNIMERPSMAKLEAADVASWVTKQSAVLQGGMGYMKESRITSIYEDVLITHIYEGAPHVHKTIIARQLLEKHGIEVKM